ncbi:hypothetical protein TRSC58_07480 [Trypanosoma rangeli SC58]|uniref:Uncharacterized protein n=1 Tax=Trypanosoma rangeli SC58 TaxID=429131 RepID=A0A061IT27_TRYRA|nr:hypothetical protein TRSC58_07480 [Trypanosoma rangeli SC58]
MPENNNKKKGQTSRYVFSLFLLFFLLLPIPDVSFFLSYTMFLFLLTVFSLLNNSPLLLFGLSSACFSLGPHALSFILFLHCSPFPRGMCFCSAVQSKSTSKQGEKEFLYIYSCIFILFYFFV